MPPILAAFFALSALLHGGTLVGSIQGVDPHSNPKIKGAKLSHEYTIVTGQQVLFSRKNVYEKEICETFAAAITPGGERMRMRINGAEQEVNWSWTYRGVLQEGYQGTVKFEFIDPITGEVEATRERTFQCLDEVRIREELTKEGWLL